MTLNTPRASHTPSEGSRGGPPGEAVAEIAALFARLDDAVRRSLAGKPISCSLGCSACCYQLVGIGIAEAVWIAEWIGARPDAREWGRRLVDHARAQVACSDRVRWFARHVPCPFLDAARCVIYERRPAACRYHFVRSPPENCALGAEDPSTERYDTSETFPHLVDLDRAIFQGTPALGPPTTGLLSHLVIHVLSILSPREDRRFWEKRAARLPSPREWMVRWMTHR